MRRPQNDTRMHVRAPALRTTTINNTDTRTPRQAQLIGIALLPRWGQVELIPPRVGLGGGSVVKRVLAPVRLLVRCG